MNDDELWAALTPDSMNETIAAHADDDLLAVGDAHDHVMGSERTAAYRGHAIVVRTTYAITVDGAPFEIAINVDNAGRVHYHGLPTRDFRSVIALVKKAIDVFPDDFGHGHDAPATPVEHGHHHGGGA